jgi:APA family basic amino acid/polyamine antiporter
VIPLLGLIGCLVMSVSLPLNVILVGVGLLITGFLLRFLFHRIWR